jgi:hypothetical protein
MIETFQKQLSEERSLVWNERECAAYHGAFWNILGWLSKQLQPGCGIELYCHGNIVLLVVTIGDL